MRIGDYEVTAPNLGMFRLDGGAMFGSVPKNLWARRIEPDAENRIPLAARSLLIRGGSRCILVDVGCGEKWDDKLRRIFAIDNTPAAKLGFDREEITDVILTHLHFDHAGGISYFDGSDLKLTYPNARVFLQRANWDNARTPNPKEKASYLRDNVNVLESAKLELIDGEQEVAPGVRCHRVDGHTRGQQWVEVSAGAESVFFPTDLVPMSHHLSVPFHMGYDICAETVMREKEAFAKLAIDRKALVVFQHDPVVEAARVALDERGQFAAVEARTL